MGINTDDFRSYSQMNRDSIEKSNMSGCFHCLKRFNSKLIVSRTDINEVGIRLTALCPMCGIDSVIGDVDMDLSEKNLIDMKKRWFGNL